MNFGIGLVIAVGCILGGYAALGGHLNVLWQPFEFVIIGGSSLGIFIVANQFPTIKDCGKAFMEAVTDKVPKPRATFSMCSPCCMRLCANCAPSRATRSKGISTIPPSRRYSRAFPSC